MILGGWLVGTLEQGPPLELPLVGELTAWRATLVIVGLPGLVISLLCLTFREPARHGAVEGACRYGIDRILMEEYLRLRLSGGGLLHAVAAVQRGAGVGAEYFIRIHEMPRATVGLRLGLVVGTFGCIGSIVGGMHADYLHKRGDRGGTVRSAILATIVLVPMAAITTLIPDPNYSLLLYAPLLFFGSWVFPLAVMTLQLFTPPSMRAQASAIYLFVVALFSMGFGSTSVALITDFVFANELKLHYSMAIVGGDQRRTGPALPVAAASDLPPRHGRAQPALIPGNEGVPGNEGNLPSTRAGSPRSHVVPCQQGHLALDEGWKPSFPRCSLPARVSCPRRGLEALVPRLFHASEGILLSTRAGCPLSQGVNLTTYGDPAHRHPG